jgi:hypothetical protein
MEVQIFSDTETKCPRTDEPKHNLAMQGLDIWQGYAFHLQIKKES